MTKYILKWDKDFKKAKIHLNPMFAMQNPSLITENPERAAQFETREEAQKFTEENILTNFSIVSWNY